MANPYTGDRLESIVANRVAYVMFADGRPVRNVDGVDMIIVDEREMALCHEAARRALADLAEEWGR